MKQTTEFISDFLLVGFGLSLCVFVTAVLACGIYGLSKLVKSALKGDLL